jgi:hypothetical protein
VAGCKSGGTPTPPNFKVAFITDQGVGGDALAVLQLILDEGASMVLHQGDFDYENNPDAWDEQISSVLGPDFPYFASIGNHDVEQWPGYQAKLLERLGKIVGARCAGDLGVKSSCSYKGLFFILSGPGTMGTGHQDYIRDQLANDDSVWRICSWHKNHPLMQTGVSGGVGWGPYEECRKGGAIIITGHEHSYARTHLMDNIETQSISSTSNILKIGKGKTFVAVSGLGGRSIFGSSSGGPWWAAEYNSSTNNPNFKGAFFCTFNENGVKNRAHCYFKNIVGQIQDDFYLEAQK